MTSSYTGEGAEKAALSMTLTSNDSIVVRGRIPTYRFMVVSERSADDAARILGAATATPARGARLERIVAFRVGECRAVASVRGANVYVSLHYPVVASAVTALLLFATINAAWLSWELHEALPSLPAFAGAFCCSAAVMYVNLRRAVRVVAARIAAP